MELTESEVQRWLTARSIEWTNWPAYLSQPIFPVLVVFYRWPYVAAGVVIVDILWAIIRYSFVSPSLSNIGCLFVVWLKWPAGIGSAIYLFTTRQYVAGTLAVLWPLFLAGFVCVPGQVGRVELALARRIGYVNDCEP